MIDNAPYHSKNTENYPTSKWRKQQFVDWLTEKNITFPDKALRAELWTLVKSEREKFPDKVMETVAKEYGHDILRLPPYHCELNPIELAWAAEKTYVAGENKDMSLDSVEKLFRKKKEELPEDFWRKCVEHVKKIEENYWESDKIQDNKVKPMDSSSSEMESFSESSVSSDSDQPKRKSCFRFVYTFYQSEEITQIFSFSNKQPLMIISAYFCNISHFTGL